MDDLQLLRDCLPAQPPPGPDVTQAARDQLAAAMADERARRHTRRPGVPRIGRVPLAGMRPARRDLLLRSGVTAAGVAAAAAVVVAVAAAQPASAPARPDAAATGDTAITGAGYAPYSGSLQAATDGGTGGARTILLTAATQVARQAQPVAERYWVTSETAGNFVRVGPASDPYTVLDESRVGYWSARSPKDASPTNAQQLGAAPVSAADQAAWQRDGSPAQWDYVPQPDGLADASGYTSGFDFALAAKGGPLVNEAAGYGSQQFAIGNKTLTLAQLQALPANPAALKKLILAGGVNPEETPSAFLLDGVLPPILQMPVTPAVRAALYEMLAAMPGIKSLGEVTDPAGQRGDAVSSTATYQHCGQAFTLGPGGKVNDGAALFASCTTQEILIIDPATGLPLAEELRYVGLPAGQHWTAPDQLFSYEIFGPSHWTNANPPASAQSSGAPLAGSAATPAADPSVARCQLILERGASASPTAAPVRVCVPAGPVKKG